LITRGSDEASTEGPEEESGHSSSFDIDSSSELKHSNLKLQKARSPLSQASRQVEVQQKADIEKSETNATNVLRIAQGGVARSKNGWGSISDDRDGGDDDFVFTEDAQKGSPDRSQTDLASLTGNRRLNPLSNRASRTLSSHNPSSPIDANRLGGEMLEQSTSSFVEEEMDVLQRSHVSNQEEEAPPLPARNISIKTRTADFADDYGDDDFEEIEEELSIGEKVGSLFSSFTFCLILIPHLSFL
jgi:hypothetical protein